MAELICRLSPLVFSVVYRLLVNDRASHETLEARLEEAELDLDWLAAATDAYEQKWASNVRSMKGGTTPDNVERLDASHAVLASWILTALRGKGSSEDFSADLRTAIFQRLDGDGFDANLNRREEFSPLVVGWMLGMVVHNDVDLNFPAIPAIPLKNQNISAAFHGLVLHVASLRADAEPWPELLGTSTLVRGVGLAEALRPEEGSAGAAIKALLRESARYVPSPLQTVLANHWERGNLIGKRNAIVHIVPTSSGGLPFLDVVSPADSWGKIKPTIQGITQFIFQEVARELADEPSEVRPGIWDRLIWDLDVWDA